MSQSKETQMSESIIDPIYLPLVPPMDLNRTMPGIDRISPFPMELRTRQGVGLFGTRRGTDNDADPTTPDFIRIHQGIDLLAPRGTPVFASSHGTVMGGGSGSFLILHDDGFKYLTFYQHLQNKKPIALNANVFAGQQLGEVGDFGDEDHLHFEIRYLFDSTTFTRERSLAVDPTKAMYQWEEKTFQNDAQVRQGHVFDNATIDSIEEVRRARLLRFFLVNIKGVSRDLFIPINEPTPYDIAMIESIKHAFFNGKQVRILWRDSLFFKNIQSSHPHASIVAEVKVLG